MSIIKVQYLLIGEIVKPQGIKGELKLRAESEDMSRYSRLQAVYLKKGNHIEKRQVTHGRVSGDFAYLTLEGINDRNAAELLRGQEVYIDRKDAIQLSEGTYFICDLIGCQATDENGKPIGTLVDIQKPNAFNDVYVFKTDQGEMMMPALSKAIISTDIESGRIVLNRALLDEIALWPDSEEIRDE